MKRLYILIILLSAGLQAQISEFNQLTNNFNGSNYLIFDETTGEMTTTNADAFAGIYNITYHQGYLGSIGISIEKMKIEVYDRYTEELIYTTNWFIPGITVPFNLNDDLPFGTYTDRYMVKVWFHSFPGEGSVRDTVFYSLKSFKIFSKPKCFVNSRGDNLVQLHDEDLSNKKALLLVEGFDPTNNRNPYDYYELSKDFVHGYLEPNGYSIFYLNFVNGGDDLKINADVVIDALQKIKTLCPNYTLGVAGLSMGGVVTRLALTKAEVSNIDLNVRLFISFDSPQNGLIRGANINTNIQYFVKRNHEQTFELSQMKSSLESLAAKQMLYSNIFDEDHSERIAFYSYLESLNENRGLPEKSFNAAIANGALEGLVNHEEGDMLGLLHVEINKPGSNQHIYDYMPATAEDIAPGSLTELITSERIKKLNTPFGVVTTDIEFDIYFDAVFIPTASALGILDYSIDIPTNTLIVPNEFIIESIYENERIPFDDFYIHETPQYHSSLSEESVEKIIQWLEAYTFVTGNIIQNVRFSNVFRSNDDEADIPGSFKIDGIVNELKSGSAVPLKVNHSYSVRENKRIILKNQTNDKYGHYGLGFRSWDNENLFYTKMETTFNPRLGDNRKKAYFKPIEKTFFTQEQLNENIYIKDPWFADANYDQSDGFIRLSNVVENASIFVFIDIPFTTGNEHYYALKADEFVLDQFNGETWLYKFVEWEYDPVEIKLENSLSNETMVNFKIAESEFGVNYTPLKRHLASDTDQLVKNNAQRAMIFAQEQFPLDVPKYPGNPVHNGNRFFMLYEENGALFLSTSENGETWTADERLPEVLEHEVYDDGYDYEIIDYAIAFGNGITTDGNRSAIGVAWIEKHIFAGIVSYYQAYYMEKDILSNQWGRIHTFDNTMMPYSDANYKGIEVNVMMQENSHHLMATTIVIEKELDGNSTFAFYKNGSSASDFNKFIDNISGKKLAVSPYSASGSGNFAMAYEDNGHILLRDFIASTATLSNPTNLSNLYPRSYAQTNPSIVYHGSDDHSDVRAFIAWEGRRSGFADGSNIEILTAKVLDDGNRSIERGPIVSHIYDAINTVNPVVSSGIDDNKRVYTLTYESAGEVIQIANLDTFSPRQWYYKNYGEGYAPTAPRYHAPGIAFNRSESGFHRIVATQADPNIGIGTLAEVQRMDFRLSPAENGGQEGLISIDMVELKKGNEALPVDKKMKTQTVNFTSTDQVSYAVSVRFINVSKALNPDKVLLSLALETGTGKLPLSNFKVREVSADSENEIKDFIKASTVTNLPVSSGKIAVDLGVASEVEHYTVLMTEEDIDNILGKAHRLGDDTRFAELLPTHFMLEQNYPNPFNPYTNITYALPQATDVHLVLYDVGGRKIRTLVNKHQAAGFHHYMLNGTDLASGVYLYSIQTPGFRQTRKLVLLK
jgi:hypothetical protein